VNLHCFHSFAWSKKRIIYDRRRCTHDDENLAGRRGEKTKPKGERTAKTRPAPSDFRKKPNWVADLGLGGGGVDMGGRRKNEPKCDEVEYFP
jgi:hypothetical protein